MNVALVLGFAECVADDVQALEEMLGRPWDGITVAVNDAGWWWPRRLDYWCSLHSEHFEAPTREHPDRKGWRKRRAGLGYPDGYKTVAAAGHEARGGAVDLVLGRAMRDGLSEGSSGLLGIQWGLTMQPKVVSCGIPMDRRPHHRGTTAEGLFKTANEEADHKKLATFRRLWEQEAVRLQGRVKSMSGWTRELFGAPTLEWLHEQP